MSRAVITGLFWTCAACTAFGQTGYPPLGPTEPRVAPFERVLSESASSPDPLVRIQSISGVDPAGPMKDGSPSDAPASAQNASQAGGAAGQNNGTNPAAPATTFIVNNEFIRLRGGDSINTVYSRFKYPWFNGKGGVTLEIPYVYYDLSGSAPAIPQIGGLGDIAINTSYNFWTSDDKSLTFVGLLNSFLPTADNLLLTRALPEASLTALNLGTGKYVLAGGAAVVYAFAPNFFVAPTYLFESSVWGNEARPEIRRGKFRLFAMYAWETGVYLLPEFQALTNYRTGATDFYLAPELGYSHKGTTVSVKPGIGLDPKNGERDWGLSLSLKINY